MPVHESRQAVHTCCSVPGRLTHKAHTQERAWRKFLMAIQRLAQEATYYVAPPIAERRPKETDTYPLLRVPKFCMNTNLDSDVRCWALDLIPLHSCPAES